jgi:uroporphyrinogen III methyltransferase/synthase
MGIGRLPKIVDRLIAAGMDPDTTAAVIQWGTRPEQRTVRATVGTLTQHALAPPSTIVIGRVAAMNLDWFESRPLFGQRVVVTRPKEQARVLCSALQATGAEVVTVPVIAITDPVDGGAALRGAVVSLAEYDWIVVTSANGARRLLEVVDDARSFGDARVAAIGPGTAAALRAGRIVADLQPDVYVAERLVEAFPEPSPGGRVLLVRASVARDVVPDGLRRAGWEVDVVDAYRTVGTSVDATQRASVTTADIVTFTSSSAVDHFVQAFGVEKMPSVVACIGPVTAATAASHGIHVDVTASVHSVNGLVDELVRFVDR